MTTVDYEKEHLDAVLHEYGVEIDARPDLKEQAVTRPWEDFQSPDEHGDLQRLRWYLSKMVIYVEGIGWGVYRDGTWDVDRESKHVVRRLAKSILMNIAQQAVEFIAYRISSLRSGFPVDMKKADPDLVRKVKELEARHKAWTGALKRARSPNGPTVAMMSLQPHVVVRASKLDCPEATAGLLVCRNGTLDLKTGTLGGHDPSLYITHKVEVEYDPEATCSEWDAFLDDFTDDDAEFRRYLQGDAFKTALGDGKEATSLWFIGPGGGGRGTYLETLGAALGGYTRFVPWAVFKTGRMSGGHDESYARFRGCRMVVCGEAGERLDLHRFKSMVDDQKHTASLKGEPEIEFLRTWRIYMSGQSLIAPLDDSGMQRRVRVAQTFRTWTAMSEDVDDDKVLEADGGLKARLRQPESLRAVLAWMAKGRTVLGENGALPACRRVQESTARHRENLKDPTLDFLLRATRCGALKMTNKGTIDLSESVWVGRDTLFHAYTGYCIDHEVNGKFRRSKISFGKELTRLVMTNVKLATQMNAKDGALRVCREPSNVASSRSKRDRVYAGVGLTDDGSAWLETYHATRENDPGPADP